MNIISSYQFDGAYRRTMDASNGHHLLVNPPLHNPVLKLRHLGVDPSIGTAGVSEGDDPRQFADPISVRTDEGAAAVSVAGGVARAAGTHHVLRDVAFEDGPHSAAEWTGIWIHCRWF